ncbi:unnamed protein product [Zymoseptoria tritici ST99CH_1A5]|uniref:ARID domain-containing protein n=1 Tax=Zymoseptoria tritici ST99CH_1A5 TaxID=1276529 RepID=A0A1Y6LQ10_ZYMTR|nr:unnamed protein product [Zymoseptoria tritici ST99CH_1A5]
MTRGDPDTAGIDQGNIINGTARSRRSTSNGGARVLRNTPARTQRLDQGKVKASAKESLKQASKVGTGRVAKTKAGTKGKSGGKKKAGASSSSTTGIKRKAPPSKPAENKRRRGKGPSLAQPQDRNGVNETADEVENEEQNGDVTMGGTAVAPRKFAKAKKVFRSGKSNRVTRSQGPVTPTVAGATAPVATAPAATAPSVQAPPPAPVPAVTAAPIQATVAPPAQTQQDEEDGRDEEDDHNVQGGAYAEHEMQGGGPEQTAGAGTIVGDAEVAGPSNEDAQEEETTDSGNQAIGVGPEDDLAEETNGQAAITGQETSTQVDDAGGEVDAAPTHAPQTGNADTETSAEQIAGSTNASKAQATTQTSQTEQTSAEKQHLGGATSSSAAPATSGVEPAAAFHPSVAGLAEAQKDTDTAANNAGGDAAGGDEAVGQNEPAAGKDVGEDTGSAAEKSNADKAEVPGKKPEDITTVGKEQEVPEDNDTAVQGDGVVDQTLSLPDLSDRNTGDVTLTPVTNAEGDEWPSFPDASDSIIEEVAQTTQDNADVEEDPPSADVSKSGVMNASQSPVAGTGSTNSAESSAHITTPANMQALDGSEAHSAMANNGTSSAVPAAGANGAVKKTDYRQEFFSDLRALHGKTKQQIDAASSVMGLADGNALDIDMFELRHMIETTSFNHSQNTRHWTQIAEQLCDDVGAKLAEGAGEKLRDFYRQWIHPLTFADQEAAYNAGYRDAYNGRDPIRRRLRKEGLRLSPHRIYLFAQIIADFGGYDMLSISRQAGDHGCTEQAMRQLHLQDENPNDPINDETAAEIMMDIYHDFLRDAEQFFPEFGPVHNEVEWSRLDRERRARQIDAELEALQQQDKPDHYKLLKDIAISQHTSIASMYDYHVGGDKIDLYALFKAYEEHIDSYGSFPHTTSDAIWQMIGREMGLNYSRRTALHRIYASYERFLRPLFRSHAHFGQLDAIDGTYKPAGTFHHQFNQAMRSLTPQGPLALGQDTVSAFRLYSAVQDRGDYNAISASPADWDNIATVLGCGGQVTDDGKTAGAVLQQGYEALFLEEDDDVHEFGDDEDDDGDDGHDDDDEDDDAGHGGAGSSYNGLSGGHSFSSHFGFLAGGGLAGPAMTAAPGTSSTAAYTQDGDDLPDASDDGDTEVSHLSDFYRLGGSQLGATASHRRAARPAPIEEYDSDGSASERDKNKQGDARKSPSSAQGSESSGSSGKRKRNASSDTGGDQGDNDVGTPSNGVKRMKTASPVGPSSPFAPLLEGTPAPSRVNANIASEGKLRAKPANPGPFIEDTSSDSEIDTGNAPRARSPQSQQLFERQNGSRFRPSARQSPEKMAPATGKEELAEIKASETAPTAVDGTEPPAPVA